jgi:hypothetical protein
MGSEPEKQLADVRKQDGELGAERRQTTPKYAAAHPLVEWGRQRYD